MNDRADRARVSDRVERWRLAWESGDPAAVVALYREPCEHRSGKVVSAMSELNRDVLRGRDEIGCYAARAVARVHPLRFDILAVHETADVSVVEYLRHAPGEAVPQRCCEVLQWAGERLASVRVYHF